jgi:hypothetical protein
MSQVIPFYSQKGAKRSKRSNKGAIKEQGHAWEKGEGRSKDMHCIKRSKKKEQGHALHWFCEFLGSNR